MIKKDKEYHITLQTDGRINTKEAWMTVLSERQTNNAGSLDDNPFTETDK